MITSGECLSSVPTGGMKAHLSSSCRGGEEGGVGVLSLSHWHWSLVITDLMSE